MLTLKTLLPYFFVFVSNAQKDSLVDYRNYFRISKEANYLLFKGEVDSATTVLTKQSYTYKNFPFDYLKVGRKLLEQNSIDSSLVFLELAIMAGYDLSSIVENVNNIELKNTLTTRLMDCQVQFEKQRDNNYLSFLDSIAKIDQMYRAETFGLEDSVRFKLVHNIDSNNVLSLKKMIELNGWPSYRKVGYKYTSVAFIVLLHGLRCYDYDSDEFIYFRGIMEEEIMNGNFDPNSYANLIDQYHAWILNKPQIFGTMADQNNILYPIIDINELNKNRYSIGLNSLDHYLEMKGYQMK